jgi:hypothetical protein
MSFVLMFCGGGCHFFGCSFRDTGCFFLDWTLTDVLFFWGFSLLQLISFGCFLCYGLLDFWINYCFVIYFGFSYIWEIKNF